MGKPPAFQFYTGDWMKDPELSMCSPASRGIWMDLLCAMYESRTATLSGTADKLARLARCSSAELTSAAHELQSQGAADGHIRNGEIVITSRRLSELFRDRKLAASRQLRRRERQRHGEVTPKLRPPSSSSSSSSSSESPSGIYTGGPPSLTPVISDDDHAIVALSRWAQASRGYALNPARGEFEAVGRFLVSMAAEPPIVHGGVSTARGLLIPKAADILRERETPFKGIKWALTCVQNLLAEWAATGVVGQKAPKASEPAYFDPFPKGGAA